ncbi:hypothetical protein Aperf_G00000117489 [Anoplocephala perfoliata]
MANIGWNFGATVPPSIGSGWSNSTPSAPPAPPGQTQPLDRPVEIGFVINEPPTPPPASPYVTNDNNRINSNYLATPESGTRRSSSLRVPKRPPPPSHKNPNFKSFEDPTVLGRSNSSVSSRSSSRHTETYERGLSDMADLMTPVDLSEAEKERIRERFALDK